MLEQGSCVGCAELESYLASMDTAGSPGDRIPPKQDEHVDEAEAGRLRADSLAGPARAASREEVVGSTGGPSEGGLDLGNQAEAAAAAEEGLAGPPQIRILQEGASQLKQVPRPLPTTPRPPLALCHVREQIGVSRRTRR